MSQVLQNGTMYSWANAEIYMLGNPLPIAGVTKIEYKRDLTVESHYGVGQEPIGTGFGNYTYTASLELYQDEWRKIWSAIGGLGPMSYPHIGNTITILFTQSLNGTVFPFKDKLYNVQFMSDGLTVNQGDTKVMITIPLLISGIGRFN